MYQYDDCIMKRKEIFQDTFPVQVFIKMRMKSIYFVKKQSSMMLLGESSTILVERLLINTTVDLTSFPRPSSQWVCFF